jgi:ribosomal protein S18 acetylase RimI-like enzyme
MADPYRVRTARPADLEALAALEQRIFPDPWALASFREILDGLILVACWSRVRSSTSQCIPTTDDTA